MPIFRHCSAIGLGRKRPFLGSTCPEPRIVVWAHNSHLGDARATEMSERGELNVGHIVRDRYAASAVLVGFTTYTGTVTAASEWDGPAHRKHVRPALTWSYERLFMKSRLRDSVASDGVITLSGFVDSDAEKIAAEETVKRVRGVRAVANDVEVRIRDERTDRAIAKDALHALDSHTSVPTKRSRRRVAGPCRCGR